MTDDKSYHVSSIPSSRRSTKGRSASICAATSTSMENLPPAGGTLLDTPPAGGTPGSTRRRRPATRSQSARITGGAGARSIRRRAAVAAAAAQANNSGGSTLKSHHYNSEPKLDQTGGDGDVSPYIRRKGSARRGQSVYHRKSAAFLDVPDLRNGAGTNGEEDADSYRLRSFSFTSKGIVNRGDSFRRRRSRSNSLCPGPGAITPGEDPNQPSSDCAAPEVVSYTVALLGTHGVGKTALISQFMTSECINAYDRQKDSLGTQSVSIMLNGEESELVFLNISNPKEMDRTNPPDAFVIMYSVVDKASFLKAESEVVRLQDADLLRTRPAILVGNKVDLARSRAVSTQDGKCLACTFRAKFVEISVGINHNVDELLVGILTQIRLKLFQNEDRRHVQNNGSSTGGGGERGSGGHHSPQWYKSRGVVRASMKARQMFTWLFGKEDSKFKNCENLHML